MKLRTCGVRPKKSRKYTGWPEMCCRLEDLEIIEDEYYEHCFRCRICGSRSAGEFEDLLKVVEANRSRAQAIAEFSKQWDRDHAEEARV